MSPVALLCNRVAIHSRAQGYRPDVPQKFEGVLKKSGSTRNLQRPNIEARSETHQKALTVASEVLNGIFARHAEREFKPWEASVPLSILTQNWPLGPGSLPVPTSSDSRLRPNTRLAKLLGCLTGERKACF